MSDFCTYCGRFTVQFDAPSEDEARAMLDRIAQRASEHPYAARVSVDPLRKTELPDPIESELQ